jgi:hypothetical protein
MKKILINFNEYLGGGETLLVRVYEKLHSEEAVVICSKDSYISKNIPEVNKHEFESDYSFHYLSEKEKSNMFNWLYSIVGDSEASFLTFCLRDLYFVTEYLRFFDIANCRVVHLLLHPLDHLYLSQTIFDKMLKKYFSIGRYSLIYNQKVNESLLYTLNKANSLISMNVNVSKRLELDTGLQIGDRFVIPLPVIEDGAPIRCRENICADRVKKIVWLGRIVDFKIPALLSMIDFVNSREGFVFDIIGYGNESVIQNYIYKNKYDDSKVRLIGKVELNSLSNLLSRYDVGYGMGTSIIELTRLGLPTIVALASPDGNNFESPICAGLVHEQLLGNVGDDFYVKSDASHKRINDVIDQIVLSPSEIHRLSVEYVERVFNLSENISRYVEVLNSADFYSASKVHQPKIGFIRKALVRYSKLL